MFARKLLLLAAALWTGGGLLSGRAAVVHRPGEIVWSNATCAVAFSDLNGSIRAVTTRGQTSSVAQSGELGLWRAAYLEGGAANAADFATNSLTQSFRWSADLAGDTLRLSYTNADLGVEVSVTGNAEALDFTARVEPARKTVTEFALPARLRFSPNSVERLVCPLNANEGVGAAFKSSFFAPQTADRPAGWRTQLVGPSGYTSLFGAGLVSRPDNDPPVAISITADGVAWLGANLANRLNGSSAIVNRPPRRDQVGLVLADSANGPYFSGARLGGQGWLFRMGGRVDTDQAPLATDLVLGVMEHLAAVAPAGRSRLGLAALYHGPASGGWASVPVKDWRGRLGTSATIAQAGLEVVELRTARALLEALAGTNFLAILNPYGEWTPVLEETGMTGTAAAAGRYVRAGGHWFEVGGYSFYYELRPTQYYSYATPYPPAFADFLQLDTIAGSASLFGVQPMRWTPWQGAGDAAAMFVPGRLAWGGDERGGYCERAYATYVSRGQRWTSPAARLVVGQQATAALSAYGEANQIRRTLESKMSPSTLAQFKRAVLVYYDGNCAELQAHLAQLPAPALIHFARYLKGGFDKEYPDHLPPNPAFGTPAAFSAFLAQCHALGHLVMPYTNPTWWCDHPRGPTFLREGEAPLLRRLDGALAYESYGANDGYTVCHWHPSVQAANRLTLRQFTEDYPIDVLFQDQCGARGWQYDLNPASPHPAAYSEGLVSMVAEDSRTRPLSTESGWDRLANYESQFCGLTWGLVPTENAPAWRWFFKERYSPETWELFPVAQYLAHDKLAFVHHDLGQFVTTDQVLAWTLGLGYSLSCRIGAASLDQAPPREWLRWLDRLQKSVCARYVGEPVRAFLQDRGASASEEDDGVLRATYGPVEVVANLDDRPLPFGDLTLAAHGFRATGPGLVAANLRSVGGADVGADGASFVVEGDARRADCWVYSRGEREVVLELAEPMTGLATLQWDGRPATRLAVRGRTVALRLGFRPELERASPPTALAGKAPQDWPGSRPAIGILNLSGFPQAWTRITPADWLRALQQSRLATEYRVPIRSLTSVTQLTTALQAGVTNWLAIINPGGENFPVASAGQWRSMLALIRQYVNQGGTWWETGGYSFFVAASPGGQGWQTQTIGPEGLASFGLPVGSGAVDQAPEPLTVTAQGREFLGDALSARLQGLLSAVNRGLPRAEDGPRAVVLLGGAQDDFLGAYRLEGWGSLWRVGGFWPNPEVVLPAAVAALEHLFTHPPLPTEPEPTRYLWHATLSAENRPAFKQASLAPGGVLLEMAGWPGGITNHVERSLDLRDLAGWREVFHFASPSGETNWADSLFSGQPQAFYRLRADSASP